jgi:hypothetical protein
VEKVTTIQVEESISTPTSERATDLPNPTNTPKPTDIPPEPGVIFEEDFEDGAANNFSTWGSLWRVVKDEVGNYVYEIDSSNYSGWPIADFGPRQSRDFIITYRVKLREFQSTNDAPMGSLNFSDNFAFTLKPYYNLFTLEYREQDGGLTEISLVEKPIKKGAWYEVRLSVDGDRIQITVNDELIISSTDTRMEHSRFSFGTAPNTTVQFDDIIVTSID